MHEYALSERTPIRGKYEHKRELDKTNSLFKKFFILNLKFTYLNSATSFSKAGIDLSIISKFTQ
jgi:hypothetical protein